VKRSHIHHYVPEWYQRRFLAGGRDYYYLDVEPKTATWNGGSHQLKAVRKQGPSVCFFRKDFYTLRLGKENTDALERRFFGHIDTIGKPAADVFTEYSGALKGGNVGQAFQNLVSYMGAQRFRTPRGFDDLRKRAAPSTHKNAILLTFQTVFQSLAAMWSEGVWEIVRARNSTTKFIVSDDPVTFYCKVMFPSEWTYPNDVSLKSIGTRTIFPLSLDSCLIITHLQLARNPWNTPTEFRVNARYYDNSVKHLGSIQFDRELAEDEVIRINYILKKRATRYIAAACEDWLYPERHVSTQEWIALDDDWFLLPHLWKVPFMGQITIGHRDGSVWSMDEYGRRPGDVGYKNEKLRQKEWVSKEQAKQEWAKKRIGKSRAQVDKWDHDVGDKMMENFLRAEGLI
jgi:hypothetical protein